MKTLVPSLIISLFVLGGCKSKSNTSTSGPDTPRLKEKRIVTILQSDGGVNNPRAVARIEGYAKKIGLVLSIDRIIIKTDEDVQLHRFIGSPTVRINGLDVEPLARSATQFGFTGRLIAWMQDASTTETMLNNAFIEAGWLKEEDK